MPQALRTPRSTHFMSHRIAELRERLRGTDPGAASVKLVSAGLAIGIATAILTDPNSTRNTDTMAEVAARIAPVGSVSIAQASAASATAESPAATVNSDS